MTTYLTLIPADYEGSPGFEKAPFAALRGYNARCPKEAAQLAGLDTGRSKHPWAVEVLTVRAADIGTRGARHRRYLVKFSRGVKSAEERK